MITIILIILSIIVLMSILPIVQWGLYKKSARDIGTFVYRFSPDLINHDMKGLKCEDVDKYKIERQVLQIRGSVRMAHNRILSESEMDEKKIQVYSVELP